MNQTTSALHVAMIAGALMISGCVGGRGRGGEDDADPADPATTQKPLDEGDDAADVDGEPEPEPEPGPEPEPEPEPCTEGEFSCSGSTLEVCYEGNLEHASCDELCGADGYTSAGCDGDRCSCDGFADPFCVTGANGMCACLEGAGAPCTDEDWVSLYGACWDLDPVVECYSTYVEGGSIDCYAAAEACL